MHALGSAAPHLRRPHTQSRSLSWVWPPRTNRQSRNTRNAEASSEKQAAQAERTVGQPGPRLSCFFPPTRWLATDFPSRLLTARGHGRTQRSHLATPSGRSAQAPRQVAGAVEAQTVVEMTWTLKGKTATPRPRQKQKTWPGRQADAEYDKNLSKATRKHQMTASC
jgi:hypothetical protein